MWTTKFSAKIMICVIHTVPSVRKKICVRQVNMWERLYTIKESEVSIKIFLTQIIKLIVFSVYYTDLVA